MHTSSFTTPPGAEVGHDTARFYRHVLETLNASPVGFLVGGAYAFNHYTGISRHTKDLDIFIRRQDYECVSEALGKAGYDTTLKFSHWLAKAAREDDYIDLIFSSGNGIAKVDDEWFEHAVDGVILDIPAKICPVEEMVWSKAFIMERERFDGADIAHLLRARGDKLDWDRLLRRFDTHWRVLLSHITIFGYVYPDHRDLVPAHVMDELLQRLHQETRSPSESRQICKGTLLSREQYLADIHQWGYQDARLAPHGTMTEKETAHWTEAIQERYKTGH